jgi:large subunit ribosomal protein L10
MLKADKERIVAELTDRLKSTPTLFVADYRGLSVTDIDELRTKLIEHGARFTIVKNTLTRRAAEAAGADSLLALLEGPTAIAFIEAEGDLVAVAKALADSARTTRILAIRGGILDGSPVGEEDVRNLATLPPADVLRSQVLGAITGPLTTVVGLISAPVRDLLGLIDARIAQLADSADADSASSAGDAEGSAGPVAETVGAAEEAEPVSEQEPDPVASAEPAEESPATEEPREPASAQAEPERTEAAAAEEAETAAPTATAEEEITEEPTEPASAEAEPVREEKKEE